MASLSHWRSESLTLVGTGPHTGEGEHTAKILHYKLVKSCELIRRPSPSQDESQMRNREAYYEEHRPHRLGLSPGWLLHLHTPSRNRSRTLMAASEYKLANGLG